MSMPPATSTTTGVFSAPNSAHWPVPMAVHRLQGAAAVNEVLARIFSVMRATDVAQHPERSGCCSAWTCPSSIPW